MFNLKKDKMEKAEKAKRAERVQELETTTDVAPRESIKSYQAEFDISLTLKQKIAVLSAISQSKKISKKDIHLFFNRNCSSLTKLSSSYDEAVDLMLFFNLCSCQKIWATTVALKAINMWLNGKSVEEIALDYRKVLVDVFAPGISPAIIERIIAEDMLKKLEI